MGRYVTGDFEHKFWFGCQPSEDIEDFGGYKELCHKWSEDDLEEAKSNVKELKEKFKDEHKISFKKAMHKIETKGYSSSTEDKETETKKWGSMCRDASKIQLGERIVKAITELGEVNVCYEE